MKVLKISLRSSDCLIFARISKSMCFYRKKAAIIIFDSLADEKKTNFERARKD